MSHLVQILLPLADNDGVAFPADLLQGIQRELSARFGGLTAYNRAPAKGEWHNSGAHQTDDIVVVEVMTDTLDADWWRSFRTRLEKLLRQDKVVIRAQEIRTL